MRSSSCLMCVCALLIAIGLASNAPAYAVTLTFEECDVPVYPYAV